MKDPQMYDAYAYGIGRGRDQHLSIDTQALQIMPQLLTPPESANSGRRSSYDMSFQHTPLSAYHPSTTIPSTGLNSYSIDSNDKMDISFHNLDLQGNLPQSPSDFIPTWPSNLDQKPPHDSYLYEDSSMLMSTSHDWSSSTLSQFSNAEYPPDTLQHPLGALSSHGATTSFFPEVDSSTHENHPAYIDPNQSIYRPEDDYLSTDWSGTSPVHDQKIVPSSSPTAYSPPTPPTVDCSFESPYIKDDQSPSPSTIVHRSRSTLGKKGRRTRKGERHQVVFKDVPVENNTVVHFETNLQKMKGSIKEKHHCRFCNRKFDRSEHCKRHEKSSHSDEFPYLCYISGPGDKQCQAGKKKNGSANRSDNHRVHHWTHLKSYLVTEVPLVKEALIGMNKKCKARNKPISPAWMYDLVRARDDPKQDEVLEFLNKEAGRDFKVHIRWDLPGCPVVRCIGNVGMPGGCDKCRPPKGSRRQSRL